MDQPTESGALDPSSQLNVALNRLRLNQNENPPSNNAENRKNSQDSIGPDGSRPKFYSLPVPVRSERHPSVITTLIKGAKSITELQDIYHSNRAALNHIHCDALLRAFANLLQRRGESVHSDPAVEAIFTDLITRVLCAAASESSSNTGTHYSRNIAGGLWSAAKVRYRGLAQLQYVLERAFQVHKDEFNSQALSNSMWAFATLRMHPPPSIVKVICDGLVREMDRANNQNIANSLWAFATLRMQPRPDTMLALCVGILREAPLANIQAVSNSLWAFGVLKHDPGASIINALLDALVREAQHANGQNIANSLWALCALGYNPGPLVLQAMTQAVQREAWKGSIQLQANASIVRAFASFAFHPGGMALEAIVHGIRREIHSASAQHASAILSSFAVLQHYPGDDVVEPLKNTILRELHQKGNTKNPQAAERVLELFATVDQLRSKAAMATVMLQQGAPGVPGGMPPGPMPHQMAVPPGPLMAQGGQGQMQGQMASRMGQLDSALGWDLGAPPESASS